MGLKKNISKILALSFVSIFAFSSFSFASFTKGGSVTIYSQDEPKSLNPLFQNSDSAKSVYNLIYSGLLKRDENFDYYPDLAVSIPTTENKGVVINDEGMIVTYKIKELAFWHDGSPVTSEDIKFTWKCYTDPKIQKLRNEETLPYSEIYKVETPDEKIVKLYFKKPYSKYKTLFKYILPKHGFDPKSVLKINSEHPFNFEPIGSGPFRFVDWKKGKSLILDSYDKYYNTKPNLDQLTYLYGNIDKDIAKSMEAGKIQVIQTKDNGYFNKVVKPHLKNSLSYSVPQVMMEELAFNTEGIFKDLTLRKAIASSINRSKIASKFYDLTPAWSDAHPNSGLYDQSLKTEYFYDLKMAQYYLDDSGWVVDEADGLRKNAGKTLTINFLTSKSPIHNEFIDYMKNISDYLGIKFNVKESYSLEEEMKDKVSYDMVLYTKNANTTGLERSEYFGSKNVLPSGKNYSRYVNFTLDDVFYSPLVVNNLKEEKEVSKLLVQDIPTLPLFSYTKNTAVSIRLQNFKPNAAEGNTWNSSEWWMY